MNEDKMYEMLMSIMQDLAVVKSKLDTLEEIKIDAKTSNAKIERLEKWQNLSFQKSPRIYANKPCLFLQ